jgi:hypothetical protein
MASDTTPAVHGKRCDSGLGSMAFAAAAVLAAVAKLKQLSCGRDLSSGRKVAY